MKQQSRRIRIGVVMAGGAGERFWPVSRRAKPKQLLTLTHPDQSMLAEAVERLSAVVGDNSVYIITGGHLVSAIRAAMPDFPFEHVLAEPSKRNTAGALTYTAAWLLARHGDRDPADITLAVTTADHLIGDTPRFAATISTAMEAAEREDALVTCGIAPTHPETGFGYIEADDGCPVMTGACDGPPVYRARAFHEKPDAARAARFLASGRHFWNSGMFFWKLSVFLGELHQVRPDMAEAVYAMARALAAGNQAEVARLFETVESTSIDYALMEKSGNVRVVKADFPWADIGSWNALSDSDHCDGAGNFISGDAIALDCNNCVVYNEPGADRMAVGVVGMTDTIVVVTEDAVLVLPRDRAQDVRAVVEELKRRNARQL